MRPESDLRGGVRVKNDECCRQGANTVPLEPEEQEVRARAAFISRCCRPRRSARLSARIFILGTALLCGGTVLFPQASGAGAADREREAGQGVKVAPAPSPTAAGSERVASANTRVSLNWVDGSHGDVVVLSLTVDAPAGISIGSLENEISFPTSLISFVSAKQGAAGSTTGAAITTELTPDPTDLEKTILKMTLSPAPASGSVAEPLPDGVLADVSFQIAEDAGFEWISLGLKSKAWTLDTPAKRVPSVVTAGGKIHVVAKGKFSCFFYMH